MGIPMTNTTTGHTQDACREAFDRIQATMCPTTRMESGESVTRTEGRISEHDLHILMASTARQSSNGPDLGTVREAVAFKADTVKEWLEEAIRDAEHHEPGAGIRADYALADAFRAIIALLTTSQEAQRGLCVGCGTETLDIAKHQCPQAAPAEVPTGLDPLILAAQEVLDVMERLKSGRIWGMRESSAVSLLRQEMQEHLKRKTPALAHPDSADEWRTPEGKPIFGGGSPHDVGEHLDRLAARPAPLDETAFQAFMLAVHEHGTSELGYRKALAAYEAARQVNLSLISNDRVCIAGRWYVPAPEGYDPHAKAYPDRADVERTPSWIEHVAREMEKIRSDYIANKRSLGLQGYDYIDAMKAALSALPPTRDEGGLVEALEFYASPKNWWTQNSGSFGYHQTDLKGCMERHGAKVGTLYQGNFIADAGDTARAALRRHKAQQAAGRSHVRL